MATEREKALAEVRNAGESFFWLVRNSQGENLKADKHVSLMEVENKLFLACKTKIIALRPVMNEKGQPGVVVFVEDKKGPFVTGTVSFDNRFR